MFHVRRYVARTVLAALLIVSGAAALVGPAQSVAQAATLPELPRVYLDTTYVPPTGPTINVPAGGDFQGALNAAQPGSVIVLQAGATYSGNFTLPVKSGTGWIYVQSSAIATLPVPGTRVTPAQAALMPKVTGNPALGMGTSAHHYRFIGVEFVTPVSGSILTLLDVNGTDIVFDRCYIHAQPGQDARTGVMVNGRRTAVIDSYLSEWHHRQFDSSAIWGFNGPGPFKFVNNYLEGSGVNLFFGGTDASSSANMPSDIEIRGNYLFKPLSWKVGDPSYAGINWVVKNIFELKNAQRVWIEGNVFENSWTGNTNSQAGFGVQFTPRNQSGGNPWATVRDVTFVRNVIRRATAGVFFLGWDDIQSIQEPLRRVLVKDNLLLEIGAFPDVAWGGFFTGMLFDLKNRPEDITIDHNTAFHTASPLYGQYGAAPRLTYTNNIVLNNNGVRGDGTSTPLETLATYFPDAVFARNALVGAAAASYPVDNFFPISLDLVGFVNYTAGDYHLAVTSPYKYLGLDGKDPGADIDALAAATANAISGTGSAPADSTPPTVALTSPLAGTTVSGTVTVSATATDNTGVAGVQFKLDGANYGAEDTTNSYSISWDSTAVSNGSHTITAVARDGAGNQATATVDVTVSNSTADTTPPVISSVTVSSVTSSGASITWTTNEPSDTQVEYGLTAGYGSATLLDLTKLTAHAVPLGGLVAATPYHFRVKSRDAAGNLATSGDFTFTTEAAPPASTQSPFKGTPAPVPGQIEAEDFDNGGEGVAYHDLTAGNQGGVYRMDVSVDIRQQLDGSVIVFNFETGEWLEYTISVAQGSTYRLELLVSSAITTSRWHAEIDGVPVTSSVVVPNTGSWDTFQWAGVGGISLTAGQHVLRIVADQQYFGFAALRFAATNSPFKGTPAPVPGQIEAEDFDNGGEGVAYHDLTAGNQGGVYRTDVSVDIRQQPDGSVIVFNFETGEWLEYTVSVAKGGTYRLELLVSSAITTSRWHAEIDGVPVTSSVVVPNTGSWDTFQWAGVGRISLTAGQHVLRIVADEQYFGFAALRIVARSPFKGTPAPVPGQIEAEDFDNGGEGVAYHDLTAGNQGGVYRTDVSVDIRQQPDGSVIVFNFETGEWLEYTVSVAQGGTYRLELLVSSAITTSRWHAGIDGVPVTGSVVVPNTGSWDTFQWAGVGGISLTAGQHVLRIVADEQYFGFAALRFAAQ